MGERLEPRGRYRMIAADQAAGDQTADNADAGGPLAGVRFPATHCNISQNVGLVIRQFGMGATRGTFCRHKSLIC